MTLQVFLSSIADEEARIELAIDDPSKDGYSYHRFWLSDFLTSDDIAKYYKDCEVKDCDIRIQIKL